MAEKQGHVDNINEHDVTLGKEKVKFNEEAGTMGDERLSVAVLQDDDERREKHFKTNQKHEGFTKVTDDTVSKIRAKPLRKMTTSSSRANGEIKERKKKTISNKKKLRTTFEESKQDATHGRYKPTNKDVKEGALQTEIINESEATQPTESWMIKVTTTGRTLNKQMNKKRANAKKKTEKMLNQPVTTGPTKFVSTNTLPSIKPTTIRETPIATQSALNSTGTPSKPTPEAASTPLPFNNTAPEYSGSGNGVDSKKISKHNKESVVKEIKPSVKANVASNIKQVSKKGPTKPVTPVYDDKNLDDNGSGESEENEGDNEADNENEEEGDAVARTQEKEAEKRILCVGDSITEGYYKGGNAFHPYTKKLTELLNAEKNNVTYNIYNEGISGECVYPEMLNRMPQLLQKYKPLDLVIIIGGTNDLMHKNCTEGHLFEKIKEMHEMAHQAGIKTVAVTIPDSNAAQLPGRNEKEDTWESVNDKLREYAQGKDNVIFCDLAEELPYRTLTDDERKKYWDDLLHYTPLGYDRMAEVIYDVIQGNF